MSDQTTPPWEVEQPKVAPSNYFPDVMVDLETTGLQFDRTAIIQIAAVKFNLAERTIDTSSFFDRCLSIPPTRHWQEGTRDWWLQRRDVLNSIMSRMEDHKVVLHDFYHWVGPKKTMWGKPTHFDHSFLSSYFNEFGPQMPFHFRMANDMNSFIRARYFPKDPPQWERDLPFIGDAHNGLHDALHQISVLFHMMDHTEGKGQYENVIDAE